MGQFRVTSKVVVVIYLYIYYYYYYYYYDSGHFPVAYGMGYRGVSKRKAAGDSPAAVLFQG